MLQINNACIAFGEDVLFSGFCMQVRKGETACIAGESGKGKTSLLNAIMGFVPLREGTITVGDLELNKSTIDIIRRQTAWIPQELALPVEWVKEMVRLPFELKANKNNPFSKKMLFDCFAELGLDEELYNKRVGEVSGGQRQRIMIAVAALLKKPLIIVDEPTSALDPISTSKIEELCMELKGKYTIVIVTHNMQQALRIADTTAFFLLGDMVEVGATDQLFSMPRDKRTEDYITGRFG